MEDVQGCEVRVPATAVVLSGKVSYPLLVFGSTPARPQRCLLSGRTLSLLSESLLSYMDLPLLAVVLFARHWHQFWSETRTISISPGC
jgi:hypothetical protein